MHNCAKWEVMGKIDQGYLYQSIVLYHAKMFQKKKTTLTNYEIKGCIIFGQIWPKLSFGLKREIFGEID